MNELRATEIIRFDNGSYKTDTAYDHFQQFHLNPGSEWSVNETQCTEIQIEIIFEVKEIAERQSPYYIIHLFTEQNIKNVS